MQNINKNVLIGASVLLIVVLGYVSMHKGTTTDSGSKDNVSVTTPTGTTDKTTTTKPKPVTTTTTSTNGGKCNLVITYPKAGAYVAFPLVVTGYIDTSNKSGCSWYQNQLRAGDVQISYNLRNQGYLASGVPVPIITNGSASNPAISNFQVSLNLATTPLGITTGTPIKLTFTELNVAGNPNPSPDHFDLNVYAK